LLIWCSGTSQLKHCEFFHPTVSFCVSWLMPRRAMFKAWLDKKELS
jgi:hypothetical protein